MGKYPVIIGRFEYIDIIDKLKSVPVKIDTGAYRSSIHASNISVHSEGGKRRLTFTLLGHPAHLEEKTYTVDEFSKRRVVSSNGHMSERYEIKLKVKVGYKIFNTAFTLADRSNNVFPVLIGRHALNGRFYVDPGRASVSRRKLRLAAEEVLQTKTEDIEGVNV